ncbi:MAG: sigma 54-interacting transcriptional regulator [Proteobacteria bacterium]|nr:sigma 54-interacting transcriptional regulator [Pseudomonadota bacterium]
MVKCFDQKTEHLFSHITTEKAPVGILWHDRMGNLVRWNREAACLLGYPQEGLSGLTVFDIDAVFDMKMLNELWDKVFTEGVSSFESTQKRKDGSLYPAELVTVIFTFDEQEYSCTFFRDVTERKKVEQKLHQTLAELEEAKQQLTQENVYLKEEIGQTYNSHNIIGASKALNEVLTRVNQVAKTKATVLLLGETGTGKELIARAIHESSDRQSKPLIKVNCATLPAGLIESELFGHEKGAFTGAITSKAGKFELADKGTLFLDEIGEMPLELQAKLLRVLQEGELERLGSEQTKRVDVRIIAATNRELKKLSATGKFREDLYYRLNVFLILCPPLRKRKEDIPQLLLYFVKKFASEIGRKITVIPDDEIQKLISYDWPGNLREFQNIIESSVITSMNGVFTLESWFNPPGTQATSSKTITSLEDNERAHIIRALEATEWKVSGEKGAAGILEMNPQTLTSRMKKLGIKRS